MDIVTYSQVRDEVVLENLGDLVSPAFQTLKAPPTTCFFFLHGVIIPKWVTYGELLA